MNPTDLRIFGQVVFIHPTGPSNWYERNNYGPAGRAGLWILPARFTLGVF